MIDLIYPTFGGAGRNPSTHPPPPGIARWVLSAGPNGIVDTPFRQAADRAVLGGDDIGVRLN